jgi:hypothetical protein
MSSEALAWAFKQECPSSSVKFTLVALCECSNYQTGRIYPSIAHITEITGQNRKTIIANIAELERLGFIADTGERVGTTKQIKVYQAALTTVPKAEQSRERNSSENAPKQSQKRDTEPSRTSKIKNTNAQELPEHWRPVPFGIGTKSASVVDGWPPGHNEQQLEHFTAHHRARGTKFKNWQDAWSTWVLNSRKFGNGTSNRTSYQSGKPRNGFAAALRHIADGPPVEPFGIDR